MTTITFSEEQLREAVKQALVEALQEQPELWSAIFREALEEMGLANAIRQGRKGRYVSEEEIASILAAE